MSALIAMRSFVAALVKMLQLYVLISVVILMPLSVINNIGNNIDNSTASPGVFKNSAACTFWAARTPFPSLMGLPLWGSLCAAPPCSQDCGTSAAGFPG